MTQLRNGQWWLQRLQSLFSQLGDNNLIRQSTRGVRVRRLDVQPGQISVRLHDRELGDGSLDILIALILPAQWNIIIERMRDQAFYAAHLLSEQLPAELEPIFTEAGVALIPQSAEEVTLKTTFPIDAQPRMLAALYPALVDLLQRDPWLLLLLRGRQREAILDELRQARTEESTAIARPADVLRQADASFFYHVKNEQESPDENAPLVTQLENYWGDSRQLRLLHHYISPPTAQLALLRRLGPIAQSPEWLALQDEFATIYQTATEAALALAYDVGTDSSEISPQGDARGLP